MEPKEAKETVADIVAEMRKMKRYAKSDSNDCRYVAYWCYQTFADRLEAAWKRETQTYLDQIRDAMNQFWHEKFKSEHAPVGNAAAMREALKMFIDAYRETSYSLCIENLRPAYQKADAALSAPPRNCDVGTAEEQTKRYDVYCYDHRNMENCCGDCPLKQAAVCEIAFGQMPYEEGGVK